MNETTPALLQRSYIIRHPVGEHVGRAWVVRVLSRWDRREVIKIYPPEDRAFADAEWNASQLFEKANRRLPSIGCVRPIDSQRSSKVVFNAFAYEPGHLLSSQYPPGEQPIACAQVICDAIDFVGGHDLPHTPGRLEYSSAQRLHFWTAPIGTIPAVSIEDHTQEFEADIERSKLILGNGAYRLLAWWRRRLLSLRPELLAISVPCHHDLNSDNVVLNKNTSVLLDVGLTINSTPFVEWGGAVAHSGPTAKGHIVDRAVRFFASRYNTFSRAEVEEAVNVFAVKRSLRRLAFLAGAEHAGAHEISAGITKQRSFIAGLTSHSLGASKRLL